VNESPITRRIRKAAAARGFDIVAELPKRAYDDTVGPEHRLPEVGPPDALAVLVGNSRALWPAFTKACAADPQLPELPNPLDRWTVATLGPLLEQAAADVAFDVVYYFEPPPRLVGMQKLAQAAGVAHLGPAYLSVHPEFGPWLAFRAVAVFDSPCETRPSAPPDPCSSCVGQPCLPALNRAMALKQRATWHDWLALRDACPQRRDARYDDEQIAYHYGKNPAFLQFLSPSQ